MGAPWPPGPERMPESATMMAGRGFDADNATEELISSKQRPAAFVK